MASKAFWWSPKQFSRPSIVFTVLLTFISAPMFGADQVEMQNGDRYYGKVLSLNSETVLLRSEVLGTVRLPRAKVALIALGINAATNAPASRLFATNAAHASLPSGTNASSDFAQAMRQLSTSSNLVQQVRSQFLADADPKAQEKFNELLDGLATGKLGVGDIRAQAQVAANQLRAARRDLGDDAGFVLDGYLSILDHFLRETEGSSGAITNKPAVRPKTSDE